MLTYLLIRCACCAAITAFFSWRVSYLQNNNFDILSIEYNILISIEFDILSIECDILSIEYDILSIEFDILSIEYDILSIEYDILSIEYDILISIEYDILISIEYDPFNIRRLKISLKLLIIDLRHPVMLVKVVFFYVCFVNKIYLPLATTDSK